MIECPQIGTVRYQMDRTDPYIYGENPQDPYWIERSVTLAEYQRMAEHWIANVDLYNLTDLNYTFDPVAYKVNVPPIMNKTFPPVNEQYVEMARLEELEEK